MKTVLLLARDYHTPIEYWLCLTLTEFREWMDTASDIVKDIKKAQGE